MSLQLNLGGEQFLAIVALLRGIRFPNGSETRNWISVEESFKGYIIIIMRFFRSIISGKEARALYCAQFKMLTKQFDPENIGTLFTCYVYSITRRLLAESAAVPHHCADTPNS
jgi:hypothetical protein